VVTFRDLDPRRLEELILSVRCQSWGRWELLMVDTGGRSASSPDVEVVRRWAGRDARIRLLFPGRACGPSEAKNFAIDRSRGDFIGLLEHDDLLHPQALGILARRAYLAPSCNFFFANEAYVDESSRRVGPFLRKPSFDLFTLWRTDCIGRFAAARRALIDAARHDGDVFRPEHDGLEDHDLFLRLALTGRVEAHHEPLFLSYRRAGKRGVDVQRKQERMIAELLPRHFRGAQVKVAPPPTAGAHFPSIRLGLPGADCTPSLLVVISFKDHAGMTVACLEALERQEHALDVHVILVNNRSADPATLPALRGWMGLARRNRYTIVDDDGPFNFARINNTAFAAHGAGRDLLLFLNNDVELESPDCLQTLAAHLLRDEGCAFAGIRLVYPGDRAIQHAGIVVGEALTGSGYHGVTHAPATRGFPEDEHVTFAVTFACAMTRCRTYRELGLLEEIRWPNGFGDIEICARALERGYRNHYFGTLVAIHHESRTRGRCVEEFELTSLYERHAGTIARWRLRTLSVDDEPAWPVVLPLRYKVADRAGRIWRHIAGPTHDPLLRLGWMLYRQFRALRGPQSKPSHLLPPGEGAPKGRMRGPQLEHGPRPSGGRSIANPIPSSGPSGYLLPGREGGKH
jgi:GT2 family glycosyltransferase